MEHFPVSVAETLIQMAEADQAMRHHARQTNEWDSALDQRHTATLKTIVNAEGWPSISRVGTQAAEAAWLIAQHADHDPEFQAQCLESMRQLPEGEVDPANRAYLEDRIRVNTNKPQLYGTQFHGTGDAFRCWPIEDEEHVDERRRAVGLKPFAEYKAEIEQIEQEHDQMVQRARGE